MFALWQEIYQALTGDATLTTLLGGNYIRRAQQGDPTFNFSGTDVSEMVTLNGITEVPSTTPVERHSYLFSCWSKTGDKLADDIAGRLIQVLRGKTFTANSDFYGLRCDLISKQPPYFDEQQQTYRGNVRLAFIVFNKKLPLQ